MEKSPFLDFRDPAPSGGSDQTEPQRKGEFCYASRYGLDHITLIAQFIELNQIGLYGRGRISKHKESTYRT